MGEVVHVEHRVDGGAETLDVQGVVDGALGHAQRERVLAGDAAGKLQGGRVQVVERDDPVDHAEPERLGGRDGTAGEQQFLGLASPELPGVTVVLHAADAHVQDGVGELGVVGGDDEIAGPAEHEPTGDALALDGGDRRLRNVAPGLRIVQVVPGLPVVAAVGRPGRTRDVALGAGHVVAGREVLPGRSQDDDPDLGIGVGGLPGFVELAQDLGVLRVGGLRPVKGDDGDVLVNNLVVDVLGLVADLLWPRRAAGRVCGRAVARVAGRAQGRAVGRVVGMHRVSFAGAGRTGAGPRSTGARGKLSDIDVDINIHPRESEKVNAHP
ncbi:hypothetical protein FMEAI12_3310019 [Parafrankia sp. Ea1.12]|nr:hypothetical protein FMEAI12_3310019 [Parafrankia sp. Ea1.12]